MRQRSEQTISTTCRYTPGVPSLVVLVNGEEKFDSGLTCLLSVL